MVNFQIIIECASINDSTSNIQYNGFSNTLSFRTNKKLIKPELYADKYSQSVNILTHPQYQVAVLITHKSKYKVNCKCQKLIN